MNLSDLRLNIPTSISSSKLRGAFTVLGGLFAAHMGLRFLCHVYKHVRITTGSWSLGGLRGKYNKDGDGWAVVTAANGGIGYELAVALAGCCGMGVVLVGRSEERLKQAEKQILESYPDAKTRVFALNMEGGMAEVEEAVRKALGGLRIRLVLNNAGIHNKDPQYFHVLDLKETQSIVQVNLLFTMSLTRALIPTLAENAPAAIVNVSSLTSLVPFPFTAVYAASKAFINHWSVALACELDSKGIKVLSRLPALTCSKMSGISTPSFFVPSAATMARRILASVEAPGGVKELPYWPHALQGVLLDCIPESVVMSMMGKNKPPPKSPAAASPGSD